LAIPLTSLAQASSLSAVGSTAHSPFSRSRRMQLPIQSICRSAPSGML
jgi:hypothetical protein